MPQGVLADRARRLETTLLNIIVDTRTWILEERNTRRSASVILLS
jgi:hypothetical protein